MELSSLKRYAGAIRVSSDHAGKPMVLTATALAHGKLFGRFMPEEFIVFGLYNKTPRQRLAYVRKSELEARQSQVNRAVWQRLTADKYVFQRMCEKNGIAAVPTLALLGSTSLCHALYNSESVQCEESLLDKLEGSGAGEFIAKPAFGTHGQGLVRFKIDERKLWGDDGVEINVSNFFQLLSNSTDPYLIQAALRPHAEIKGLMPGRALGTFRIVTFRTPGGVLMLPACIKIPLKESVADNFTSGESGNYLGAIDSDAGVLLKAWRASDSHPGIVVPAESNPESGASLTNVKIPGWKALCDLVKDAANTFDKLPTLGFDVALTDRGPMLIEANAMYDCDILQIAHDRGFRRDFDEAFNALK